jgi:acyl carrier protein
MNIAPASGNGVSAASPGLSMEEFRDGLLAVVRGVARSLGRPDGSLADIGPDTPLFAAGLLDSLSILNLVAFVESATGRAIPSRMVVMDHFRTVRAVCEAFGCGDGREKQP